VDTNNHQHDVMVDDASSRPLCVGDDAGMVSITSTWDDDGTAAATTTTTLAQIAALGQQPSSHAAPRSPSPSCSSPTLAQQIEEFEEELATLEQAATCMLTTTAAKCGTTAQQATEQPRAAAPYNEVHATYAKLQDEAPAELIQRMKVAMKDIPPVRTTRSRKASMSALCNDVIFEEAFDSDLMPEEEGEDDYSYEDSDMIECDLHNHECNFLSGDHHDKEDDDDDDDDDVFDGAARRRRRAARERQSARSVLLNFCRCVIA
jgi:hypothetical protein